MEWERNGVEVLASEECRRLLGAHRVGRLAVSCRALPVVLPVGYELDGDDIVVRVARGSSLETAARHSVVAFEVDEIDPGDRSGWSVSVTGLARPRNGTAGDGIDEDSFLAIATDVMFGLRNPGSGSGPPRSRSTDMTGPVEAARLPPPC